LVFNNALAIFTAFLSKQDCKTETKQFKKNIWVGYRTLNKLIPSLDATGISVHSLGGEESFDG
jgi:hypothetical protein